MSGKMIGTAVQSGLLRTPQYDTVAARHFNYPTAEYEMKMGSSPEPRLNDYASGDAIVGFAMANGMRVKGQRSCGTGRCRPGWRRCRRPIPGRCSRTISANVAATIAVGCSHGTSSTRR